MDSSRNQTTGWSYVRHDPITSLCSSADHCPPTESAACEAFWTQNALLGFTRKIESKVWIFFFALSSHDLTIVLSLSGGLGVVMEERACVGFGDWYFQCLLLSDARWAWVSVGFFLCPWIHPFPLIWYGRMQSFRPSTQFSGNGFQHVSDTDTIQILTHR